MKSCFFIGHREAPDDLFSLLKDAVERHISDYGVREFIVGHYGNFDRLAANAVISAKKKHTDVVLSLLLPYHPAERPIKIPQGFDNSFYPPGLERVPRKFAIVRANHYMVDNVDFLIAYAWHPASSARDLVEYAKEREKRKLIKVTLLMK